MGTLVADVVGFVRAVIRAWLFVSGSALVAVLGFANEHFHWTDLSGSIFTRVAVGLLYVACFRAWRDERGRRHALTVRVDADLTELARFRTTGVNLQARTLSDGELSPWLDDHMQWAGAVAEVLRRRLPEDQWSRFTSLGELDAVPLTGPVRSTEYFHHRLMLRKQLSVLEALMTELRAQVNL